jgi:hypothetical protein
MLLCGFNRHRYGLKVEETGPQRNGLLRATASNVARTASRR